jgi:hypothetical protein
LPLFRVRTGPPAIKEAITRGDATALLGWNKRDVSGAWPIIAENLWWWGLMPGGPSIFNPVEPDMAEDDKEKDEHQGAHPPH